MFLYARLVLDGVFSRSNVRDIREEAHNLPDGLDEALIHSSSRFSYNFNLRAPDTLVLLFASIKALDLASD